MKRIVWMLVIAAAIVTLATFWSTCMAQVVLRAVVKPAGGVGAFLPSDSANLILWLAADSIDGLNDGDSVTSWLDLSSAGNDFSDWESKPVYKTNIVNGKPVVRWNNAQCMITTDSVPAGTYNPISIFVVAKPTNGTDDNYLMLLGTSGGGIYGLIEGYTDNLWEWFNQPARITMKPNPLTTASFQLVYDSTYTANIQETKTVWIIGGAIASDYFSGDIAEIVLYKTGVSATLRQKVIDYLTDKYNL